jgi:hypothetical protein
MLGRQFCAASVTETLPGVWEVRVTYSAYGLYQFVEVEVCDSREKAKSWLLYARCGGRQGLRVVDINGLSC